MRTKGRAEHRMRHQEQTLYRPVHLGPVLRLRTNGPRLQLAFSLKLGVMQATGIAERAGSIGTASPLGCVDAVAAVASARRRGALRNGQSHSEQQQKNIASELTPRRFLTSVVIP
jgi:hypothetical protein